MLGSDSYKENPQTYVKHFFLEKYLQRLAYKIYSFHDDFVYVDGFSGPWKSSHEKYDDTSFAIALRELKNARSSSFKPGQPKNLRCFFVEENPQSYKDLKEYLDSVKGANCVCSNNPFEKCISEIRRFVGSAFSFCFIDPTGWTGFSMESMLPLLNMRGEVLINFMFTEVNRFIDHPDEAQQANMDKLFGGIGWREEIQQKEFDGHDREEAIVETYCDRLKVAGKFKYVTSTPILFGDKDRTYFHLIYGTNHSMGLEVFREVEEKAVLEQEKVRAYTKINKRNKNLGMNDLFEGAVNETLPAFSFERTKSINLKKARVRIIEHLKKGKTIFKNLKFVLELQFVWMRDVKDIIERLERDGLVEIVDKRPRQRRVQNENLLKLL